MQTFQKLPCICVRDKGLGNGWNLRIWAKLHFRRWGRGPSWWGNQRLVSWSRERGGKGRQVRRKLFWAILIYDYFMLAGLDYLWFEAISARLNQFLWDVFYSPELFIDVLVGFSDLAGDDRFECFLIAEDRSDKSVYKLYSMIERHFFPLSERHCSHAQFCYQLILLQVLLLRNQFLCVGIK